MLRFEFLLKFFFFIEMSFKMRFLDREVRGLKMEKEDIERVSFILFLFVFDKNLN